MSSSLSRGGTDILDDLGGFVLLNVAAFLNYSNLLSAAMSNYSVYFLLNDEGINMSCSVYSLTSGSIRYQDYFTGDWLENITLLLPAYYVTNCLMSELQSQIAELNYNETDVERWLKEYGSNPYNQSDNGDAFVALLFMILGLCVLCWMLILLFLLSPKHKKKPLMTQIATGVYSIVTTILLDSVTLAVRKEYEKDSLDMIRILLLVNDKKRYPVALVVLQFLTCLAFFQLVVKMTKPHYKFYNGLVGACLIIMYIVVDSVELAMSRNYLERIGHGLPEFRTVFKVVLKLLFMVWICVTLGYHTLKGTASSPRQVSYSRRLLPLALFTWFLLGFHVIITILIASLWKNSWLVTSWITFLPYLLEMYILTTAWEWYYSIRDLELRLELIGMLGRKISLDDVMTFSNNYFSKSNSWIGTVKSIWNKIRFKDDPDADNPKEMLGSTQSESSSTAVNNTPPVTLHPTRDLEVDLGEAHVGQPQSTLYFDQVGDEHESVGHSVTGNPDTPEDGCDNNRNDDDSDDDEGYEVQYVDDFDIWEHQDSSGINDLPDHNHNLPVPQEGQSSAANTQNNQWLPDDFNEHNDTDDNVSLPPFKPLPGFNRDDYWDDK